MADPSDPTCPKGVPEEDVADFATGDIDDGTSKRLRAHLAECGACRGLYAEYRVTMLALRRRAAPSEAAPPRAWWRLGRLRWAGAAAAALVLGVLAVQTGLAGRLLRAVVHLVGGATGEGSFEDAARRILALDRDGAGIPPDARIRRDFCDIRSAPGRTENGPPGTLVVHERHDGPTVVLGIAAFAPDGSKLWALGDAGVLPRWGRLLPGRQYGLAQLRTFASGGLNGDRREVAVATVLRPPESALLLFDPATGRELAIVGRRVPVAVDADVPPGAQSPVPLPPDAGGVRNLLVCCSIHVSPTETAPAALVISPEGRLLQLARFPRTPVRPERGSVAVGARVRWPRGDAPGEVTVFTSEEVEWRFAVLDGLLVAESVTAALADAFPALWDRTVRETTHAARFPDPGSADEFLSGLERGVAVERDPPEEKVWLE